MEFLQDVTGHGMYFALALVGLVSAVFPPVSVELAVAGLTAGLASPNLLLLVGAATVGQMAGKSAMYWVGRRGAGLTRGRYAGAVDRWGDRFRGSRTRLAVLLFVSSASGLPPFYLVSTLAGAFRTSYLSFLLFGSSGRALRFAVVGLFPLGLKAVAW